MSAYSELLEQTHLIGDNFIIEDFTTWLSDLETDNLPISDWLVNEVLPDLGYNVDEISREEMETLINFVRNHVSTRLNNFLEQMQSE